MLTNNTHFKLFKAKDFKYCSSSPLTYTLHEYLFKVIDGQRFVYTLKETWIPVQIINNTIELY